MTSNFPTPYNLRTIFELRMSRPLKPRTTVGRLFWYNGKAGLADASGALWPVHLEAHLGEPEPGTALLCQVESLQESTEGHPKHQENEPTVLVTSILDTTPCRGAWPNTIIDAPIPDLSFLHALGGVTATQYLKTATCARTEAITTRNRAIERTREFFQNRGFIHMETPSLVPSGGVERYLSTFETGYHDFRGNSWPLALPTSPEFALKKLLAEGHGKIFQLARSFRNTGELARWHEPEFIMLEWYRSGTTLESMMDDTRNLVLRLEELLTESPTLPTTWKTFRVADLFNDLCAIDLRTAQDEAVFRQLAARQSNSIVTDDDWDSVFCKLFMEKIEPVLKDETACFVAGYPRQMGALARTSIDSDLFVDRFEAYLHGVEICNGYHELTDTTELDRRFSHINDSRPNEVQRDEMFERTMRYGLPPCSGNALGLDRVIAILSGRQRISDLMAIPFLSQFSKGTVAAD
jgi:lysyl-tRNA synthetase class 2